MVYLHGFHVVNVWVARKTSIIPTASSLYEPSEKDVKLNPS